MTAQSTVLRWLLALCLITVCIGGAVAASPPPLPSAFYGDVSINGNPAPAGTVIAALIDGTEKGSLTTTASGTYGGNETWDLKLLVQGTEADLGQTITFRVGGAAANEQSTYTAGAIQRCDLSVDIVTANFTANVTSGTAPLTVQFTDTSTGDPATWNWTFGDGGTATEQNPVHTYTAAGNYTISLTASKDNANGTVTKEQYIRVQQLLPAGRLIFNVNYNRGTANDSIAAGTSPCQLVYFAGVANAADSQKSISGNLSFALDAPSIVALIPDTCAELNGTRATWHFPPATTIDPGATLATTALTSVLTPRTSGVTMERVCNRTTFTEAGAQQVTLQMTFATVDLDGLWGRLDCTETVDVRPAFVPETVSTDLPLLSITKKSGRIEFVIDHTQVEAGRQYTLSCAVAVDPIHPATYAPTCAVWEVTDAASATAEAGTTVTLPAALRPENVSTVAFSSDTPCRWSCSRNDHIITSLIQRAVPIPAPVANFTANVTAGIRPLTVQFTDTSTGEPTFWSWSFGDGETSSEQNPVHTYTAAGAYTVNLTVTNAAGTDATSVPGYITVERGTVSITAPGGGSATIGDAITLTGTNTDSTTTYLFLTGPGLPLAGANLMNLSMPVVSGSAATFTVAAVAVDDTWEHCWDTGAVWGGALQEGVYTVYAVSEPKSRTDLAGIPHATVAIRFAVPGQSNASFVADVTGGPAPLTVRFTDTSSISATSWSWTFGDGGTSTAQNPVHTYAAAGNYTVALTLNGGGETCTRSAYIKVTPILFGDANGDGAVNQADTLRVLKEVVGLETKPASGTEQFQKTDVHRNGIIEVGDALFIAQYNVGLRDVWFTLI
ncbi:PKD domain-containing protein [Methanoculleus frigidifontis]|uniref:PKD domain-containing protein n=1 Tax=Methanoculleus frigidifontis TaxID=2584085 RepID=UPI00265A0C81|nr:PKD domain-containing protein [Methanoculleus sp. FWC-SCC1]